MAGFSIQRVRVRFTVTRADNCRLSVTCEFLDHPQDVEALAPVLRSGRFTAAKASPANRWPRWRV